MAQSGQGESNTKGKAVAASSSAEQQPKQPEFNCPRYDRTFHSAPALCGHQSAHRLPKGKDPMKMSPVLAAVLNNPLPPHDKPVLIPKPAHAGTGPRSPKLKVSKRLSAPDQAVSPPRYHPYPREQQQKKPHVEPVDLDEEVNSNSFENNPDEAHYHNKKEEEVDEAEMDSHYQMQLALVPVLDDIHEYSTEFEEEHNSFLDDDHDQCLITRDLLREWTHISSFHDHVEVGKASYSVQILSADQNPSAINLRNFALEDGEVDGLGLQLGFRKPPTTVHLDLELKLGF